MERRKENTSNLFQESEWRMFSAELEREPCHRWSTIEKKTKNYLQMRKRKIANVKIE